MPRTRYTKEIIVAAKEHGLDPDVVEAMVLQESAGNTDAFRFEPDFWNRYLKGKPEWAGKNPRRVSSSYGLMQIMFPVALEDGMAVGTPPEMLFIPEVGLKAGCTRLQKLMVWADTGWPAVSPDARQMAALAAYNGGRGGNTPADSPPRNGTYARQVLAKLADLRAGK